jgi:hypothetical protein
MHFIEVLLAVSPDAGSGTLELCLFAAPIIILGLAVPWRRATKKA